MFDNVVESEVVLQYFKIEHQKVSIDPHHLKSGTYAQEFVVQPFEATFVFSQKKTRPTKDIDGGHGLVQNQLTYIVTDLDEKSLD